MRCGSFTLLYSLCLSVAAQAGEFFTIEVVDDQTSQGVPLVELETVNQVRLVTDSAGLIAFSEPGLMDKDVFFRVRSHGYEFPADGFGFHGKRLHTTPGESATIRLHRKNIAERVARLTGQGIYRDSILVGRATPIEHPLLNAGVLGSDSVMTVPYRGKLYWFWGDTQLARYPLGLFHTPGATSPLPSDRNANAGPNLNLTYFTDEHGIARNTAKMPGSGPTWLSGLTVLRDEAGKERMFAGFAKIKPPLQAYERGIVEFDPQTENFQLRSTFSVDTPVYPDGHPLAAEDDGVEYIYFARPFPDVRVRATPEKFLDVSQYEAYTYLLPGSTRADPKVDRTATGRLNYAWKRNTPPRDWHIEQQLLKEGKIKTDELHFQLKDQKTGTFVNAHSGSVFWNEYRQRYVMIALEFGGSSPLGEIWYAESKQLLGPWQDAVKIVTHDNYSFYNPRQHPCFDEDGGRVIYFEGTYTHTFSGNTHATPRYDYNQILYRLDLNDGRLHPDKEN